MSIARLRLAFASEKMSETMFSPEAPFSSKSWGTGRFPTPLHAHGPQSGA